MYEQVFWTKLINLKFIPVFKNNKKSLWNVINITAGKLNNSIFFTKLQ